jgi:nucleoside-diphosphate-sugar epimerase
MLLVTGATGRIGHFVRTSAAARGVEMTCQSRRDISAQTHGRWLQWTPGEPEGEQELHGVQAIIHLAGATPTAGTPSLDDDGFTQANCLTALSVLKAAARHGVRRVLLASSASVYGPPMFENQTFSEEAALSPTTPYARSKVAMEEVVANFAATPGAPELCVLRIANVAGADQLLQNARKATAQAPLTLDRFQSGKSALRSYIGPRHLGDTLLSLATHPAALPPVINVAAAEPVRMADILKEMAARRPCHWRYRDAGEHAIERVVVDVAKLENLVGPYTPDNASADLVEQACIAWDNEELGMANA